MVMFKPEIETEWNVLRLGAGVIDEVSRDVEVSGATWVVMEDEL